MPACSWVACERTKDIRPILINGAPGLPYCGVHGPEAAEIIRRPVKDGAFERIIPAEWKP